MVIHHQKELSCIIPNNKPLLVMFPFAGGNSYSYRGIIEPLEKTFDILCPELPGRGNLSHEPLEHDMQHLVKSLFSTWIKPLKLKKPYLLYGHSMGALTVYLLLQHIIKNNISLPAHVIVSGKEAPIVKRNKSLSSLPSVSFWQELKTLGGVPEELLSNEELKEYFEPIIRSDMRAIETYAYEPTYPLDIPISVLYGSEEGLNQESLLLWKKETTRPTHFMEMQGDHFFIFNQTSRLVSYMERIVAVN